MKPLIGEVTSTKRAKTATVVVARMTVHPVYQKRIRVKKKFHAHNKLGAKEGDRVKIRECRPLSKTKRWQIIEIIKKDKKVKKDMKSKKKKK
jgi:small subunit ribosomal protein S17